jgi:RAB protein geranylgeranyltransferase component A
VLVITNVNPYLVLKQVDGSYVLKDKQVNKVPATDMEAASTPLVGFFEKRRLRSFIIYVQEYEPNDAKTHKGYDLKKMYFFCKKLYVKHDQKYTHLFGPNDAKTQKFMTWKICNFVC